MAKLVTVEAAAEQSGKSVRSIWRYVAQLEAKGISVVYRVPGLTKSLLDWDEVAKVALSQKRGRPRRQ